MPSLRVYQGPWPRVRLAILERDGWLCQIKGPGCTTRATAVDHIVPVLAGGSWYEPGNLRGVCTTCNNRRVNHGSRRWQYSNTYITVVAGDDQQTYDYVRLHSQPSDLIVDITALTRTLGNPQAASLARHRLIQDLSNGRVKTPRAWITSSAGISHLPHHRVIDLGGTSRGSRTPSPASTRDDAHTLAPSLAPSRAW